MNTLTDQLKQVAWLHEAVQTDNGISFNAAEYDILFVVEEFAELVEVEFVPTTTKDRTLQIPGIESITALIKEKAGKKPVLFYVRTTQCKSVMQIYNVLEHL